jgi:hypothetical protein
MTQPTPEQLAEADRVCLACCHPGMRNGFACRICVAAALAAAFERGREEEREACAMVAEEYGKRIGENTDQWSITHSCAGLRIAQDIRARKTEGATDEPA